MALPPEGFISSGQWVVKVSWAGEWWKGKWEDSPTSSTSSQPNGWSPDGNNWFLRNSLAVWESSVLFQRILVWFPAPMLAVSQLPAAPSRESNLIPSPLFVSLGCRHTQGIDTQIYSHYTHKKQKVQEQWLRFFISEFGRWRQEYQGVQGHLWLFSEFRASLVYIPCLKKIRNMVIGGHQQDSRSSKCLFYGKILTRLYTNYLQKPWKPGEVS